LIIQAVGANKEEAMKIHIPEIVADWTCTACGAKDLFELKYASLTAERGEYDEVRIVKIVGRCERCSL